MDQAMEMPYYPVSHFYKQKFGEKVYKIPVALAGRCPNMKDGSGLKTCIFCDEWGSFAYPQNQENPLSKQIAEHQAVVAKRYNTQKFFVYFQAYTTTYTQAQAVRVAFNTALEFEDVVGVIIGTRPDCLSPVLLETFNSVAERSFMAVELGVQSFDDRQLQWMRRGHDRQKSIQAIQRIKKECPQVNLGIHLIFGWPGETREDVIEAAHMCNQLGIDNVKLHNLHVLKNTDLEKLFHKGEFIPLEIDEYADRVGAFLSHLSPQIAVHRLTATASRWDELVSPQWTRHKMKSFQYVIDFLNTNQLHQGMHFAPAQ
jgi:uncharacterized protein